MRNISDVIEAYLKQIIQSTNSDVIEIKRSEIADRFQCVPSQINYVINTRFTVEKGYIVESKRGGGGYISIMRLRQRSKQALLDEMLGILKNHIYQHDSLTIIGSLHSEE